MARKKHLGRGLSALIPTEPIENKPTEPARDADSRPADIFFGVMDTPPKVDQPKSF